MTTKGFALRDGLPTMATCALHKMRQSLTVGRVSLQHISQTCRLRVRHDSKSGAKFAILVSKLEEEEEEEACHQLKTAQLTQQLARLLEHVSININQNFQRASCLRFFVFWTVFVCFLACKKK